MWDNTEFFRNALSSFWGAATRHKIRQKTPDEAYAVMLPTVERKIENWNLLDTPGEFGGDTPPIQTAAPPTSNPEGPILGAAV